MAGKYNQSYLFATVLILAFSIKLQSQEQFGMAFSNYSPTSTVFHNPATIVDSEVMIDIHLGGFDAFLHSDYAYIPGDQFSYVQDVLIKNQIPDAVFNNGKDNYSLFSYLDIHYPSISYQYKQHGIAITNRLRSFAEMSKVPEVFANAIDIPQIQGQGDFNYLLLNRDLSMKNINISVLSFGEFGVSYANAIQHFDRNLLTVGASLKYLAGVGAGGLHISNMDYRIDTSGTFTYSNFNAIAAKSGALLDGGGISGDIGFVYKRMLDNVTSYNPFRKEAGCRIYDYKWKVGISLVDLGTVRFKNRASKTQVTNASGTLEDFSSFIVSNDPEAFLIETFGVDSTQSTTTNQFSIALPAALIFQYDFNFENNYFISVEFVQGVTPKSTFGIKRPQMFMFSPRYESRYFELSMPIGIYNLNEFRAGIMVRLGPISIGTDKLGTYLSLSDVTGFDLYAHCAFKILHPKSCGKRRVW